MLSGRVLFFKSSFGGSFFIAFFVSYGIMSVERYFVFVDMEYNDIEIRDMYDALPEPEQAAVCELIRKLYELCYPSENCTNDD